MKRPPNISAFTINHSGRARTLITAIEIGMAFDPKTTAPSQLHEFKGLWDTGATNCAITQDVVDACQLKPVSMAEVNHADGVSICEVYYISIMLPNGIGLPTVRATKCAKLTNADMLIGMDIITSGDFIITNTDAKTVFSFRVPSIRHIDYVQQIRQIKEGKVGKNHPCPCGSGEKFKRCCAKTFGII